MTFRDDREREAWEAFALGFIDRGTPMPSIGVHADAKIAAMREREAKPELAVDIDEFHRRQAEGMRNLYAKPPAPKPEPAPEPSQRGALERVRKAVLAMGTAFGKKVEALGVIDAELARQPPDDRKQVERVIEIARARLRNEPSGNLYQALADLDRVRGGGA